ncbi:MAG: discoidin domain-containing protein [Abditibacteriota bacterium]|nr:discoidin domain-containing protein [Abditibacteriota bacterium]
MRFIILIILCLIMVSCNAQTEFSFPEGNAKRAEWMSGKYGMMTHFLPQPKGETEEAKIEDFNNIVNGFDLKLYMKQFDQSGAEYLIFTVGQGSTFWNSPNSVIDKIKPGHCSKRDLMLEIAKEVKKRKKGFIFYIPCDCKWCDDGSGYYSTWAKVCEEYSKRLGKLCDGWWVDGCIPMELNTPEGEKLANAMRAGNPKSALAFSDASFAGDSMKTTIKWNDYFPGEVHVVEDGYIRHDVLFPSVNPYLDEDGHVRNRNDAPKFFVPEEKYIDGVLLQALIPMDLTFNPAVLTEWVPYPEKDVIALAHSFTDVGGAITFNVPFENYTGKIKEESLKKLIAIGKSYKGANAKKKYPLDPEVLKRSVKKKIDNPNPLNVAFEKPSLLLSHDTTQVGEPSGHTAYAYKGNDGLFDTAAAPAYMWNWTYQLDLEEIKEINRMELTFNGWSTDFDIFVSEDGENWALFKHIDNLENKKEFKFDMGFYFRYIRVRSNKPDDAGQVGGQMSVAELQLFE